MLLVFVILIRVRLFPRFSHATVAVLLFNSDCSILIGNHRTRLVYNIFDRQILHNVELLHSLVLSLQSKISGRLHALIYGCRGMSDRCRHCKLPVLFNDVTLERFTQIV